MSVETVRMSSRGQIVIPLGVREELNADEGTVFAVAGTKDTIVLKKIVTPNKEDLIKALETIAKEGRKRAEKLGIKESDIPDLVHKTRESRMQK